MRLHFFHLVCAVGREEFAGLGYRWPVAFYFEDRSDNAADNFGTFFHVRPQRDGEVIDCLTVAVGKVVCRHRVSEFGKKRLWTS